MTTNNYENIESALDGNVPFEAFQERSAADVADKVRFLYGEYQARVAVRNRGVESLLQQECEIGTRLGEVVRAYGWFNDVGEKEKLQLNQELRNVEKERRRLYESTAGDLLKIKTDLIDALLEYRALRRRQNAFTSLLGEPNGPQTESVNQFNEYDFPVLAQYLAPRPEAAKQSETPPQTPTYQSSARLP
jgi:hypothetical protein